MEIRKENPAKPSGSLLIKIFAGYTILALLVIGLIAALWHEKNVFAEAEKEENTMLAQRELTSRTFKALVSLFLDNESAYLREMPDRKEYSEKENRVFSCLMNCGKYIPIPFSRHALTRSSSCSIKSMTISVR